MDRRTFLTRLGILTAAAAVMDPAELIERLAPRRLYVPGVDFAPASPFGVRVTATTAAELNALMKAVYCDPMVAALKDDSEIAALFRQDRRMRAGDGREFVNIGGLIVSA